MLNVVILSAVAPTLTPRSRSQISEKVAKCKPF
jgi:hypothetical protein